MDFLQHHPHHDSDSELKLLERREIKSSYIGANLQSSRTPSAIDNHCRNSYEVAKRKLHSSRAKVRFYVTGENNHNAIYAVSPQRFATFDNLLGSLTKAPICREEKENYTFSLNGSHKITALGELHPGESYVCATYDVFEQLSDEKERPISSANRFKNLQSAALAAARPSHTSQSNRSRRSGGSDTNRDTEIPTEEKQFIADMKPKLITVLRGGVRPRKSVRILLGKKNTRSFEHTVAGIGEILSPGEQVKRIFGMSGRLVMCLADFYLEDSVFFAYCQDKMSPEDLTLDKTEVKCVGAYRFRKASAYGRVTLTSHQKGVHDTRHRSLPSSALPDIHQTKTRSRPGSRAKSCISSLASISPLPQKGEKDTQEVQEENNTAAADIKKESDREDQRPSSQASIKTVSQKSDESKESIHLQTSRPPSTRPQSQSVAKQPNNSYPNSPVHSPSKKRYPSRNSESPTKEKHVKQGEPEVSLAQEKSHHSSGASQTKMETSALQQKKVSLKGSDETEQENNANDRVPSPTSKSPSHQSPRSRASSVLDKEGFDTQKLDTPKAADKLSEKALNKKESSSAESMHEVATNSSASEKASIHEEKSVEETEEQRLENQDKDKESTDESNGQTASASQEDKTNESVETRSSPTLSKRSSKTTSRRSSQSSQASISQASDQKQDRKSVCEKEMGTNSVAKEGEEVHPRTTSRNSDTSVTSKKSRRPSENGKAESTENSTGKEEQSPDVEDNQSKEQVGDEDEYSIDFEETTHDSKDTEPIAAVEKELKDIN